MKRVCADAGLLFVAIIWGLTFPVVKSALHYVSPFAFNSVRFFLAFLLFLPFLKRKEFKAGFAIGSATFIGYAFQTVGLEYTTATNSGLITSLYVVLTPAVAYALYKEKMTNFELFSVVLAFSGVYLLTGYTGFNYGDLLTLLCSIAFAFEIAMISKYAKMLNPLSLAGWQVFAVGILSAFATPLFTEKFEVNEVVAVSLLVTAILATFVAKILQNYLQSYTKSVDAGIILSTEGIFSHLFGALLLNEKLVLTQYIGVLLMVLAVILVSTSGEVRELRGSVSRLLNREKYRNSKN